VLPGISEAAIPPMILLSEMRLPVACRFPRRPGFAAARFGRSRPIR
jgi:hypothetical protein